MTENLDLTLAQDLPVEPPPPPSHETRLLEVIAQQDAEIEAIRGELPAAVTKVKEVDQRRREVDFALSRAEQKLNILSGSQSTYRDNQRAQALAKILTGDTTVRLEDLPQTDPADSLSAGDLKEGIAALRRDRTELGFTWNAAIGGVSNLRKRWYKAKALKAGAQYMLARESIFNAWSELRAIESCAQEMALHHTPQYVHLQDFDTLVLPAADRLEAMAPLRVPDSGFGLASIRGENLRMTGRGEADARTLKGQFDSMINAHGGLPS